MYTETDLYNIIRDANLETTDYDHVTVQPQTPYVFTPRKVQRGRSSRLPPNSYVISASELSYMTVHQLMEELIQRDII